LFFETINAAGVQVPLVISVWDDDYGISVHAKSDHQREYFRNFKGFQRMTLQKGFLELRDGIILN
jgi:TPP-dependent pyruvate/acetoin dehydrogenase alpha subunit